MNLKMKLAASLLLAASTSMAQAATFTYSVVGKFNEPMIPGTAGDTWFKGQFNWDGTTVSNFSGTMNESMVGPWTADPANNYTNYGPYTGIGAPGDLYPAQNTYNGQLQHLTDNQLYMLNLNKNLIQSDNGTVHTASIFKENNSDVYAGGGYTTGAPSGYMMYGSNGDGNTPNENAFFTVVFNHDAAGNITSLGLQTKSANAALVNLMAYGDCTIGSMMGANADYCMAGEPTGASMMHGTPLSLEILKGAEVAAVPVPGAVWLFGSALLSLLGVNRRKSILSA